MDRDAFIFYQGFIAALANLYHDNGCSHVCLKEMIEGENLSKHEINQIVSGNEFESSFINEMIETQNLKFRS